MMIDGIDWPPLTEPYATALHAAVAWILEEYAAVGIIACGSIIRGNPAPNSDFDIVVVNREPRRQRVQRRFNRIPTEIFVNPPAAIRHYFEHENRDARPSTAHMIAHGRVLLARDPVVAALVAEANEWWRALPAVPPFTLAMTRYGAVDLLDNAADLLYGAEPDPINAELLLQRAIHEMVRYYFLSRQQNLPRDKEFIRTVSAADPAVGALLQDLYAAGEPSTRLHHACRLADLILGVHEFYAWATESERFPPA